MSLLKNLIEEDFGIIGNNKWFRAEQHDSLVYNAEKDIFYWNKHGIAGDAFVYLTQIRGMSPHDAKEYIKLNGEIGTFIVQVKDGQETYKYPGLVSSFHQALKYVDKSFFYARTITDETMDRFQLGYWKGFYTIPIFQDGLFVQMILRKDYPKKLIRKYYAAGETYLYNSDTLKYTKTVYITESPISAIILEQNGLPSVSHDGGAQGFKKEWFKYFLYQTQIIILGDNDSAGISGAIKTAKILGVDRCKIYCFEDQVEKYGADDFFIDENTKEDLITKVNNYGFFSYERPEYDKRMKYEYRN